MFKKNFSSVFLFIGIVFFFFNTVYAQEEEGEIIVVSERVGEVIDIKERNRYNLFPDIKGFKSAVLLKLPDGRYVLKITYTDEITGKEKVMRLPRNELTIRQYRIKIDGIKSVQYKKTEKKPPLSLIRLAGEFFAGGTLGAVFGYGVSGGSSYYIIPYGAALGSSLGVYLVGEIGNETGSFLNTLLGSTCGVVCFLYTGPDPDYQGSLRASFAIASFTVSTLGAVIGFNVTRKYDAPPESGNALINFRDGQVNLALPAVSVRPNHNYKGDFIHSVDLVKMVF